MRIVHTADWHLGDRLGRIDRTDDLRRAVERVADCCTEEKADVLLVAGDLFSELAGPESLRDTIRHLQETFAPFMRGGGTVLTLTGNHDKENFCQTLQHAMRLASPGVETLTPGSTRRPALEPHASRTASTSAGLSVEVLSRGRFYLATGPTLLRLEDRASAGFVQFVLMPYPTPARYLTDEAARTYQGLDEKNRYLLAAYRKTLVDVRKSADFDRSLPTVLSAHITVQGSQYPRLFRLTEQEDVVVPKGDLPAEFAYIALGHIHKAQAIGGRGHIRYSGSVERMDLGEALDEKEIVVLDIGPAGLMGEPRVVPMPATAIYEVNVNDPKIDVPALRRLHSEAKTDLVRIVCTYTAGEDNREELLRELEEIFPRWYDRRITERNALSETLSGSDAPRPASFQETVRSYLRQELQNHADAFREAVLARAEALLREDAE
jgi:DNA repair protein SbcD/Mre11